VSCASVGDCSAGGDYSGRGAGAFVVTEQHGIWGTAKQVPGPARLGGGALMQSVSCGSAGNCSVGRSYGISNVPPTGSSHAFVVSEQHGIWGNAKTFPVRAILWGSTTRSRALTWASTLLARIR